MRSWRIVKVCSWPAVPALKSSMPKSLLIPLQRGGYENLQPYHKAPARLPRRSVALKRASDGRAGEPFEIKKAVCLHEEDAGVVWKHTELRTMHPESRRARRLVISTMVTVGALCISSCSLCHTALTLAAKRP